MKLLVSIHGERPARRGHAGRAKWDRRWVEGAQRRSHTEGQAPGRRHPAGLQRIGRRTVAAGSNEPMHAENGADQRPKIDAHHSAKTCRITPIF